MTRAQRAQAAVETAVGLFFFLGLALLAVLTIALGRESFLSPRQTLVVHFQDVGGLRTTDGVLMRGMIIGKVRELRLEENRVVAEAVLDRPLALRADYRIEVKASSVLGGRFLHVYPGSEDAPALPAETRLYGSPTPDVAEAAGEVLREMNQWMSTGGLGTNLVGIVADLRALIAGVKEGRGTLGRLVTDPSLYDQAQGVLSDTRVLVSRVKDGTGSVGRLLSDDETLYSNLVETVTAARNIAVQLESGQGTIGLLLKDAALYEQGKAILDQVKAAVEDVREIAPISTFSSVLFGAF